MIAHEQRRERFVDDLQFPWQVLKLLHCAQVRFIFAFHSLENQFRPLPVNAIGVHAIFNVRVNGVEHVEPDAFLQWPESNG